MSSTGRDDVDDTRVYCHRRAAPLLCPCEGTPSFRFGLKIAILGGFRGILGPRMGPPKYLFAQMDPTIAVGIENYYTGPT